MKNIIQPILLVMTLILGGQVAMAHAIWIESKAVASKNQEHSVKIFYGEYASGEIENTDKWYSDLKNIEVWVHTPSQKKVKLQLVDQQNHLSSSFVPSEDGTYYISTVHTAKELGGTTKYEFSSLLPVQVGRTPLNKTIAIEQPLSVNRQTDLLKQNAKITLLVQHKGKPLGNAEVIVMSSSGWTRTYKSDSQGLVSFDPLWKGAYVIEASNYQPETGNWEGKAFTHAWQGTTTFFEVK
jgi:uncharacterized GH25 family protein